MTASLFHGTRGAMSAPFLLPGEQLSIVRRTCDDGLKFPDAAEARVVIMVQPPTGDVRALVLKQGDDGPCLIEDPFTLACGEALKDKDRAACVGVSTLKVTGESLIDLEMPFVDPTETPFRGTSGKVVVAVASQNQDGEQLCKEIRKYSNDKKKDVCLKATTVIKDLHACIDTFVVPAAIGQECKATARNATFFGPTLLPRASDSHEVCGVEAGGKDFCKVDPNDPQKKPASEIHYVLDARGNILVPMTWETSLSQCKQDCKLRVRLDVVPPLPLELPNNRTDLPTRNYWLQSYTMTGHQNDPEFAKFPPAPGTRAFWGTTDEPKSVLRFERSLTMCEGTSDRCDTNADCDTGVACKAFCSPKYSVPCTDDADCAPDGTCRLAYDYFSEHKKKHWQLDRQSASPFFCESKPEKSCESNADCPGGDCVKYRLTLGGCECPYAQSTPVPRMAPPSVVAPLIDWLQIPTGEIVPTASSEDGAWMALIVPRNAVSEARLPDTCRAVESARLLVIANGSECTAQSCAPICPPIGAGELQSQLAVFGSQVRFLQMPAGVVAGRRPNPITSWFERLFGRDDATRSTAEGPLPSLRLVDARHPTTLTTVSDVVTGNANYDPMKVESSGATRFRIRAGHCVSDGHVLGIPSLCRPEAADECPTWSQCVPGDVTIVLDLSVDHDRDGIPDRLDPMIERAAVATTRARR